MHVAPQWQHYWFVFENWLYLVFLGLYYVVALMVILEGYTKELFSTHRASRVHRVLWQFHTGEHIHAHRTYERGGRKVAGTARVATPEGKTIIWNRHSRPQRAIRNNGIIILGWGVVWGMLFHTRETVTLVTVCLTVGAMSLAALAVWHGRKKLAGRPSRPIKVKVLAHSGEAVPVVDDDLHVAGGEVLSAKPQLDGGVPLKVMALLLAEPLGISAAETERLLTLTPERGELRLPDSFAAVDKQRDAVEAVVRAQTSSTLAFTWATSHTPRMATWIPVKTELPRMVSFSDYWPQMQRLRPGEFGVGVDVQGHMYVTSHNEDTPWHQRCAGAGSGKSTGFQIKLTQICIRDPAADVYCVDTKQVSFQNFHGIPGVHVYDDPLGDMAGIWNVFYDLADIMDERYKLIRTHQARKEDFNDIWVLIDEGNDLAGQLKMFYVRKMKKSGDPSQPPIWPDAIGRLFYLGREVHIRGEAMFQNVTDRVLGGVSLRDAFGVTGMAAYKKNQWNRIIGTTPVPECRMGPGRIMMVNGTDQTWVQGFYAEPDELRELCLAGRKDRR